MRVSREDIEARIVKLDYIFLKNGRTTICAMEFDNEYVEVQQSSAQYREDFNEAKGKELAYERCIAEAIGKYAFLYRELNKDKSIVEFTRREDEIRLKETLPNLKTWQHGLVKDEAGNVKAQFSDPDFWYPVNSMVVAFPKPENLGKGNINKGSVVCVRGRSISPEGEKIYLVRWGGRSQSVWLTESEIRPYGKS